jgi:hypothetical protein
MHFWNQWSGHYVRSRALGIRECGVRVLISKILWQAGSVVIKFKNEIGFSQKKCFKKKNIGFLEEKKLS